MEQALFSITCTTCKARLKVCSEEAIGAILECPKCGGMVEIVPPEGWEPEASTTEQQPAETEETGTAGPERLPGEGAVAGVQTGEMAAAADPAGIWTSPTERLLRKWLLLGTAPVAGLIVLIGLWLVYASGDDPEPPPNVATEQPAEPHAAEPHTVDPAALPDKTPAPKPGPLGRNQGPSEAVTDAGEENPPVAEPDREPVDPAADPKTPDPPAKLPAKLPGELPNETPDSQPGPATAETLPEPPPEPGPDSDGPEDLLPENPLEAPPARVVTSPPPVKVDVAARLAETIPEIELHETPAIEAIEFLVELSTVPITFDTEAMLRLGVTSRQAVSIRLEGATLGQILETVASQCGLVPVVRDGQVLLTDSADPQGTLRQRRYTVSDLAGSDPTSVAELAKLIETLVAPESWREGGGPGTVRADGDVLVIEQTAAVHHQVFVFCEKLRGARGKPLRSRMGRMEPERFSLITRRGQARRALDRPVTANFHEPTSLPTALAYLRQHTDTDLLVDRQAMAAVGLSPNVEVTLAVAKQPLAAALERLLRPAGLAYRVIDARTLQITTHEAAAARLHLEFYPIGELLTDDGSATALRGQIESGLAASTWSGAGGRGVLHFDRISGRLIVLQSQPVHAALGRLLAERSQVAVQSPRP